MNKPWALVLSGGGAKGIAHVGVLKGLEILGLKPDMIIGTSIGSIIGGLYCSGRSADWLIDFITKEFDMEKHLDSSGFWLGWGPLLRLAQGGTAIRNMLTTRGADSGTKILELFQELTGNPNIEDLEIPFHTNAVDLLKGTEVPISDGPLALAMRSSMSFPGVFEPVDYKGGLLIDGGVLDNMPVWIARREGIDTTIAIDLEPFDPLPAEKLHSSMDVFMRSYFINCNGNYRPPQDEPSLLLPVKSEKSEFEFSDFKEYIIQGENLILHNRKKIESILKKKRFLGLF